MLLRIVFIVLLVLFSIMTLAAVLSFVGGGDMVTDAILIVAFGGLATWMWQLQKKRKTKVGHKA